MGNTSGRIGGKEYFHCPPHYGRVVKLSDIHAVRNPRVGISLCVLVVTVKQTCLANTVEPRYNKGQRDSQNMFAITRFCCIKVLFYVFYSYRALLGPRKAFVMPRSSLNRIRGLLKSKFHCILFGVRCSNPCLVKQTFVVFFKARHPASPPHFLSPSLVYRYLRFNGIKIIVKR